MAWQWFHRLGSPRWFYEKTGRWLVWFAPITIALLVIGFTWGLAFAPVDAKQGNSYRIIFIHMPAAVLSLAGYYLMAIAGGIGLIWKMKLPFMVMKSAAVIGVAFTALTLITGSLWGYPTWGTFWEWDARNIFMLILLFLYLSIVLLGQVYPEQEAADKVCAILALVGTVNVPIIYKSVDWWYSLHQPASIKFTGSSSIHPSMLYPLLLCIVAYYCFYTLSLILYTRQEILAREARTKWVAALVESGAENRVKG